VSPGVNAGKGGDVAVASAAGDDAAADFADGAASLAEPQPTAMMATIAAIAIKRQRVVDIPFPFNPEPRDTLGLWRIVWPAA
jgi:hypothetical protein